MANMKISILRGCVFVCLMLGCAFGAQAQATQKSLPEMEKQIAELINHYRISKGKAALKVDERLSVVCRNYCEERAAGKEDDPDRDLGRSNDRIDSTKVPHNMAAELQLKVENKNDPAAAAVAKWLDEQADRNAGLFYTNAQYLGASTFNSLGVGAARNAAGKYFFSILLFQEAPDLPQSY